MATNIELRRANGSDYEEKIYFKTAVGLVEGLREITGDYVGKIKTSYLSQATNANSLLGIVKLSNDYAAATPNPNTALSQQGAKWLYEKIQNLESPIDYWGSLTINSWADGVTFSAAQTSIRTAGELIDTGFEEALHPGSAVLINCTTAANLDGYPDVGDFFPVAGYWLWIYDGVNFEPVIDFPDVPSANDSGANVNAMTEGIMTKAMIWKLKNISTEANKVVGNQGTANGTILIDGIATNVYLHPTTSGDKHIPTGGAASQILKYNASGTAVWDNISALTLTGYSNDTSTGVIDAGDTLTEALSKIMNTFTSQDITDHTNNGSIKKGASTEIVVYTHPTTSGNKHIPTLGAANNVLKYSADGTAAWEAFTSMLMTSYSKTGDTGAIAVTDTLAKAFSRIENQLSYIPLCANVTALNALADKTAGKLAMLVVTPEA